MAFLMLGLCLQALAPRPAAAPPVAPLAVPAKSAGNWLQWRGPLGTGEAPGCDPPLAWAEGRGVRFKRALPGLGHSTPIVSDDWIILTCAVATGEPFEPRPDDSPGSHDNLMVASAFEFVVVCVDRADGSVRWIKSVHTEVPLAAGHVSGSLASASPVSDGELIFASFGSYGVHALDASGEVRWQVDLGQMQSKHGHGEGSSPALFEDTLVVCWDHEGPSFLVALDKHTGTERWRVERDEVTSWSSPLIAVVDGRPQVIVAGTSRVRGHDLESGEPLWECGGLSQNVVATPLFRDGLMVTGSSYEKQAMLAIRLEGARGDLSVSDRLAWVRRRRTPYVPSPVLAGDALYFLLHYQGILARVDFATGAEPSGPFRLAGMGDIYASPVSAAGRIYVTDREGTTLVLSDAREPEVLARNVLEDRFSASAAVAGDELFLRGEKHLYCIARP